MTKNDVRGRQKTGWDRGQMRTEDDSGGGRRKAKEVGGKKRPEKGR